VVQITNNTKSHILLTKKNDDRNVYMQFVQSVKTNKRYSSMKNMLRVGHASGVFSTVSGNRLLARCCYSKL